MRLIHNKKRDAVPSVIFRNAGYAYPDRQALADVSLSLEPGTHTVLTGRNGSGKSTLLALAAGVLQPTMGAVSVTISRRPAFVIQQTRTPESVPCTVRLAVEMGRWPHRRGLLPLRALDRRAVATAMMRMGIEDLAGRQLSELSGGQRQRTLVAQGLAQESDILILDEPTAGLDGAAHQLIRAAVDEELRRGVAVIESTHDLRDSERADRIVTLERGRVRSDTRQASPAPRPDLG